MLSWADWERGYGVCHWRSRNGIVKINGFKRVDMRHYTRSTSEDCWREDKKRSEAITILEHRWQGLEARVEELEAKLGDYRYSGRPSDTRKLNEPSHATKRLEPFSLDVERMVKVTVI
jgi:hypothetical protein